MVQAACPQCANKITVDDARAPERPFAVKCPKCQATVRFPGRGAAAPVAPAAPSPSVESAAGEVRGAAVAANRRESADRDAGHGRKVLVALADPGLVGPLTQPLARLGYTAEVLDAPEEGGRMLEDGLFDVVIASRAAPVPGRPETLLQRVTRLAPTARRRIFLVLVGDEYKTGDGNQAFAAQADLVVNPRDAAAVEGPLLSAMAERARLYKTFLDVRRQADAE